MKTFPYKTNAFQLAERFLAVHSFDAQFAFICNLLVYKNQNIIRATEISKLSALVQLHKPTVFKQIRKKKSIDDLMKFCTTCNDLLKHGFLSLQDLRFLTIEANQHIRSLPCESYITVENKDTLYSALIRN